MNQDVDIDQCCLQFVMIIVKMAQAGHGCSYCHCGWCLVCGCESPMMRQKVTMDNCADPESPTANIPQDSGVGFRLHQIRSKQLRFKYVSFPIETGDNINEYVPQCDSLM